MTPLVTSIQNCMLVIPLDQSLMEKNLYKLGMPSFDVRARDILEEPLSKSEMTKAIKAMLFGKSQGPDGFPVEVYKSFSDLLSPLLVDMF